MFNQQPLSELGVKRAHCYDSNYSGSRAGGFTVQDQPGLHSKTLFLKSQSWVRLLSLWLSGRVLA